MIQLDAHACDQRFAAIILAAGYSSRMGDFKPLLPLGDQPAAARVVQTCRQAGIGDVVVVTGHQADRLPPVLAGRGARLVHHPQYAQGMFSSIQAGIRALRPGYAAFFVLPVDIALVRSLTMRLLQSRFSAQPGSIVHPCFDNRRGHPPLIPAGLAPEILADPGQQGLQGILSRYASSSIDLPVPDRHILHDMDRPDAYRQMQARCSRWDIPSAAECEILLRHIAAVPVELQRHCRQVAAAAVALAKALRAAGISLDIDLIQAAALLHDIAKGHKQHAQVGAGWLEDMGFGRIAGVMAVHHDLAFNPAEPLTARHILYLADKYVHQDRFIPLQRRFQAALDRFGADPAIRDKIVRRQQAAQAICRFIENVVHTPVAELIQHAIADSRPNEPH
jgi:molybdenum cofactor cytidylyltransferase